VDSERVRPPLHLVWWRAIRPKTLSLAAAPVLAGSAWAGLTAGAFRPEVVLLALVAAVAIQIGTNLWNDALDGEHGVDAGPRLGPRRATAAAWLKPAEVRQAAVAAFAFAGIVGSALVAIGDWPILAIGAAGIACGVLYSAGPRPLEATPVGEIAVLAFFGVGGVVGTVMLHGATLVAEVWLLGVVVGVPAAAVLLVNNHRDRASDRRAGRRTLAIVLGVGPTRALYGLLLASAASGPLLLRPGCATAWLVSALVLVPALGLARGFAGAPLDPALNRFLAATGRYQLLVVAGVALVLAACR
jgi:1,4-dihydroxy-2-naphthoate octaprenyltransferase